MDFLSIRLENNAAPALVSLLVARSELRRDLNGGFENG